MQDVRDVIFQTIAQKTYCAELKAEKDGVLSGVEDAQRKAEELGVQWISSYQEGDWLEQGKPFARILAGPKEIAMAEEQLIGTLAKASGIATAARRAVEQAAGRVEIVSGSWKKMPPQLKTMVRRAIATGGASFRICEVPMLYIDKNFIRMLGSIPRALKAVEELKKPTKIIQIKGLFCPVEEETRQAVEGGAKILMVDTGSLDDLDRCRKTLESIGCREKVKIAFAGNVRIAQISELVARGVDILCIGKEIVDAGLLDMKLDVVGEEKYEQPESLGKNRTLGQ